MQKVACLRSERFFLGDRFDSLWVATSWHHQRSAERSSGGRRGKLEGLGEGLLAGSILLKLGPVGEWLGQEKQGLLAHGLPGSILHLVFHHRPAHRLAWAWQARSSRPFLVAAGVVACLVPVFALSSPFSL
jgi:hypothetical protein